MSDESRGEWNSDQHVVVLPELPASLTHPKGEPYAYPSSTIGFVKSMRSANVPIELAVPRHDAVFVSHNAADLWMPILQIGAAMLAGAGGNLISSMVEKAFARVHESARVHLDWRVKYKDGSIHRFKYDGPVRQAKQAALLFEQALKKEVPHEDD